MLHLLGKGQAPEWNEDKHDVEEVFALLCYRGIHYAKWAVSYTHLTLPTNLSV